MMDAIERAGAGAAIVHIERGAKLLADACHQFDLAAACSDLAEPTPTMVHHAVWLKLAVDRKHAVMEKTLAQASSPYRIRECGNVVFLERDRA